MSEDKKNAKEASNIFHKIMRAFVKPKNIEHSEPEQPNPLTRPICGLPSQVVRPIVKEKDGTRVFKLICPKKHEFEKRYKI